ncbi:MAG: hypothetical protein WC073_12585 [Sterolibacterium sp.]
MVLIVLSLIWLAGLNRLHELQEMGEKTAVEITISNINAGLRWEMADRIMTGREASIVEMDGSNPVHWLEKAPEGYLGEYPAMPDRFPPGAWYFDTSRKELRYRPILERNLTCRQCERIGGKTTLGWHIVRTANPMFGRGSRVRAVTVATYRWF